MLRLPVHRASRYIARPTTPAMPSLHLVCLLSALALSANPSRPSPDIAPALADLTASSATARAAAQQALTTELRLSHLDLVTRAVVDSAHPELRWRLAEAIAGDGKSEAERLELASLLAGSDPREGPRAVGEHALTSLCLRWLPDAREELTARGRTLEDLSESSLLRLGLDPNRALGPGAARALPQTFYGESLLARAVDSIARHSGEGTALILTPEAAQIARDFESALAGLDPPAEDPERFRGSASGLIAVLSERYGLELEGHRTRSGRPFILLRERRESFAGRNLLDLLVRWVRILQEPESSPETRRDAARALAASGWPAALEWLTWRAFERADAAAFDGVLAAAGRGLAVPRLLSLSGQARLLRLLEQKDSPQARIARALGVFPGVDAEGRAFAPALFEGYANLDPAQRFTRLLAAELRGARAPVAIDAAANELRRGRVAEAPQLALQALRTLAAMGLDALPADCQIPVENTLLQLSEEPALVSDFASLGALFGLEPPLNFDGLQALSGAARRRAMTAWVGWLFDSERVAKAEILSALDPFDPEAWALVLERERVLGRARTALRLTLDLAEEAQKRGGELLSRQLERSLLTAGIADRDQEVRLGNALLRSLSLNKLEASGYAAPVEDLAAVGTLVAGPLGREATEALAELVRAAEGFGPEQREALVRAARRARSEFLSSGLESRAQSLNTSLRLASGTRGHPLRRAFRAPSWPPPELPPAISIESLERRLP